MTKLFRPSTKSTLNPTDSSTSTSALKTKLSFSVNEKEASKHSPLMLQRKIKSKNEVETNEIMYQSLPTISNVVTTDTLTMHDDTISLESLNSHISFGSHVSLQSSALDILKNESDLILVQSNDCTDEKIHLNSSLEQIKIQKKDTKCNDEHIYSDNNDEIEKHEILNKKSNGDNKIDGDIKGDISEGIGTIYDQNIIQYTVRLISSKFLLLGKPNGLISDKNIRVSIKNLSLNVISNCIKIEPTVLMMTIEIDKIKLGKIMHNDSFELSFETSNDNSSNEVTNDFQTNQSKLKTSPTTTYDNPLGNDELLEIKDDHFGECTTTIQFLLNSPLSKSADDTLISKLKISNSSKNNETNNNSKLNNQLEEILSSSEIIEPKITSSSGFRESNSISWSMKSSTLVNKNRISGNRNEKSNEDRIKLSPFERQQKQFIYDILLFYNHPDPILRGNVQIIVGNFIYGSLSYGYNEYLLNELWNLNRLLAILIKVILY